MLRSSSSAALLQQKAREETVKVAQKTGATGLVYGAVAGVGSAVSATALTVARKIYPEYLDPISANIINEDPEYTCNVQAAIFFAKPVSRDMLRKEFEVLCNAFER